MKPAPPLPPHHDDPPWPPSSAVFRSPSAPASGSGIAPASPASPWSAASWSARFSLSTHPRHLHLFPTNLRGRFPRKPVAAPSGAQPDTAGLHNVSAPFIHRPVATDAAHRRRRHRRRHRFTFLPVFSRYRRLDFPPNLVNASLPAPARKSWPPPSPLLNPVRATSPASPR